MKTATRPALLTIALLALTTLILAGCYAEVSRPPYNECDWPNDCDGEIPQILSDLGSWAKTEMVADRAKTDVYQRIVQGIQRTRNPDLVNREDEHVCTLKNPTPCQELRDVHAAARAAKGAPDADAKAKWQEVARLMDRFPSGRANP